MKLLKIALAATVLTSLAASAQAQERGAYINLGIDAVEFDAYTLSGKLGYDFNDFFAIEGQAGFGLSDDNATFDELIEGAQVTGGVEAGIDWFAAGFAKVQYPVSDRVNVFARGGYHFTKIGFDIDDITVTSAGVVETITGGNGNLDTDGFALGGGAEFMLDELNGIRVEYTFFDVDKIENVEVDDNLDFGEFGSDLYSISYVRKF